MALRRYIPKQFFKTVASSAAPEFLADNPPLKLYGITFIAEKAFNTPNTGNVTIQIEGEDAKLLESGREWTWPMPEFEAGYFDSKAFKIKVATNGDGVHVLYHELA